jgi:hypothetical protein
MLGAPFLIDPSFALKRVGTEQLDELFFLAVWNLTE